MNDFDSTSRRIAKEDPEAFLRWLLADFDTTAQFQRWVDTRRIAFPGKGDQTGDLVAELNPQQAVQALWALANEFQLEPDPLMTGRMLIYLGTLWCETRPDPLPGSRYSLAAAVINLTGTSGSMPASASFIWPGSDAMGCSLQVRERYLAEESAQDLLAQVASGRYARSLLAWMPLLAGGSEPEAIARWLELATGEPDERRRANLGYHTLIFAEKSADPGAWQKELEGWGMIKSETMEKTRVEGRVEGQQTMLLDALAFRSKSSVPQDLESLIRGCADADQLRTWFHIALTISTIDEFRQQTRL